MINSISKNSAIESLTEDISKNTCVFLIGAGISMGEPTNLPSGNELKDILIDLLFYKNPIPKKFHNKITENDNYKNIVPEIVLQNVYQHIGSKLFDYYEFLRYANRNENHLFFESLCDKNFILTTNFELLIENNKTNENILHLHGDLNNPKEMTMLINKVGKGVDIKLRKKTISELNNKNLYVFGYSGNDKDIMDLIAVSNVKNIFWLLRNPPDEQFYRNIKTLKRKSTNFFISDIQDIIKPISKNLNINLVSKLPTSKDFLKKREKVLVNFKKQLEMSEKIESIQRIFTQIADYESSLKIAQFAVKAKNTSNWIFVALIDNLRIQEKYKDCYSYIEIAFNKNVIEYQQKRYLANLYNLKGLAQIKDVGLTNSERYKDSMKYFEIAEQLLLEHFDEIKSISLELELSLTLLGRIYNNQGQIFNELKEYENAIYNYKQSIKIKRKNGDIIGIAYSTLNLAFTFNHMKSYSNFFYWKNQFLKLTEKYNLKRLLAYYYREIGMDRCIFGHKKIGIKYLELAKEIYLNDVNIESELKTTNELIRKYKYCG